MLGYFFKRCFVVKSRWPNASNGAVKGYVEEVMIKGVEFLIPLKLECNYFAVCLLSLK